MKESIVGRKSYLFALKVIQLYKVMKEQKEFVISKQLLRCSTSICANIEEANAGYSHKEFAVKMSIASKEAREARYWIRLLFDSGLIMNFDYSELLQEIDEIIKMLTKM
jgi:four helix bundle protein